VVVVEAQHVEVAGRAAERGFEPAAQHVPRLVLLFAERARLCVPVGVVGLGHHVDQRIGVHDARIGPCRPQCIGALQRRAHEVALQFVAARRGLGAGVPVRMHQRGAGGSPGEKRDFVDGLEHRRPFADVRRLAQAVRHVVAKTGEAARKVGGEKVHPVGHAVVVKRPDHLQPAARRKPCGAHDIAAGGLRPHGRERAPADALAHGANAQAREQRVVFVAPRRMAVGGVDRHLFAAAVEMVGAFIAAHPERPEQRRGAGVGVGVGVFGCGCK
jgi:hypothetical protein